MKKNVAVIGGGYSSEAEVSFRSVATVFQNFDQEKFNAFKVILLPEEWYVVLNGTEKAPIDKNDFSFQLEGEKVKFDYAFIVIHGTPGEDGKLQGYFDMLQIPYNTCGQLASTITFDKYVTISMLKQKGYPVADSVFARSASEYSENEIVEKLGLPVFVKPNDGGSSYGVTRVSEKGNVVSAIENALEHGNSVLIESEMKGTEVTCGIYTSKEGVKILGITEVVSENEFFDYAAKYQGKAEEITPARISPEIQSKIEETTKSIYQYLGMKGMSRIDYIIKNNVPHVLEVNTTPGMTETSFIPQQVKYSGMELKDFFNEIVERSI